MLAIKNGDEPFLHYSFKCDADGGTIEMSSRQIPRLVGYRKDALTVGQHLLKHKIDSRILGTEVVEDSRNSRIQ